MSEPSRRETKKLRHRNAILAAAEELFSEKGFKGTTMLEVSERAGLSKGAVYLYFKSKEELYLSVCLQGIAGFGESLEAARASVKGVEAGVKAVYLAYIKHSLEEPAVFRVLRDTFIEQIRQNLSWTTIETVSNTIKGWLENESRLLQEGIDAGVFRTEIDPYAFSVLVWRMGTSLIELALLQDPIVISKGELDPLFEKSIEVLIEGIKE
jgi:AcrR family transcriptional regulator